MFVFVFVILHIHTGNAYTSSVEENFLSQPIIPCHIDYYEVTNGDENQRTSTEYEVSIATSWMRHKGCYFLPLHQTYNIEKETLEHNSPGRCSLVCELTTYFGLRMNTCICSKKLNVFLKNEKNNCKQPCPQPWTNVTCGGSDEKSWYLDVYKHSIDLEPDPEDQDNVKNTCMAAKRQDTSTVAFKAVSCNEKHEIVCLLSGGPKSFPSDTKPNSFSLKDGCPLFGDDNATNIHMLPDNEYVWTSFNRYNVVLCSRSRSNSSKILYQSSKCQLRRLHNVDDMCVFVNDSECIVPLRCNLKEPNICTVLLDKDIRGTSTTEIETSKKQMNPATDYDRTKQMTRGQEYTSNYQEKKSITRTIKTYPEYQSISINQDVTTEYELNATNNTLIFEKSVFIFQIGFAISASCLVILIASLGCCFNRPHRGTYTFPISRSEENIVMATEGPPQHTIPTAALAENYSEPKDKAVTASKVEGPRFCATSLFDNTNCKKTENGEYQHLDFTLRSETTPRFADNNEYDHVRANVISVFEQPWDTATSKVNKLFSQISKSVVQKGQNARKSLIKRRASRYNSPKLKCRASDYCDAWKTQLNKQQFVFDSDVDNQSEISIDVANSTVDSNKNKPELRRTDSAFPVLPYSERINVKSKHIYDEPDDRRMSFRERLLHMISIRPLKMPFGIELDLRASRSKSKIYSLATSIDEKDESVA